MLLYCSRAGGVWRAGCMYMYCFRSTHYSPQNYQHYWMMIISPCKNKGGYLVQKKKKKKWNAFYTVSSQGRKFEKPSLLLSLSHPNPISYFVLSNLTQEMFFQICHFVSGYNFIYITHVVISFFPVTWPWQVAFDATVFLPYSCFLSILTIFWKSCSFSLLFSLTKWSPIFQLLLKKSFSTQKLLL